MAPPWHSFINYKLKEDVPCVETAERYIFSRSYLYLTVSTNPVARRGPVAAHMDLEGFRTDVIGVISCSPH